MVQAGVEGHVVGAGARVEAAHPQAVRPHNVSAFVASEESPPHCFCIKQLLLHLAVACITVPLPREHFSFSFPALICSGQFIFPAAALCCHPVNCLFKVFMSVLPLTQDVGNAPPPNCSRY